MTALVALSVGGAVYLLALLALGLWAGERPGSLQRLLAGLRGRPALAARAPDTAPEGLSRRQGLLLTLLGGAVLFTGGLLFFRSWPLALVVSLAAPLYPLALQKGRQQRRRDLLTVQFGLALQVMAASLRAGASLRTAVERAPDDLGRLLAGQRQQPMVAELQRVVRDLQLGFSLEEALVGFRDRLRLEDVTDFVEAVLLCRVRGGNAARVMARVAEIIEDKISVQQQVLALTAGKRMEAKMVTFGPPVLVILLGLTNPGYMAPLYETFVGQVMLIGGTLCLAAAYLIGRRLLRVEI